MASRAFSTITAALAGTLGTTAAVVIPIGASAPANADLSLLNGRYAIVGGADNISVTATSSCAAPVDGCTARLDSTRGWSSDGPEFRAQLVALLERAGLLPSGAR